MLLSELIKDPAFDYSDVWERNLSQLNSCNWGVWGKERYSWTASRIEEKHLLERKLVREMVSISPARIAHALNFSYGICDLSGYSRPLELKEHAYLSSVYKHAVQFSSSIQDPDIRFLIQELYCIRQAASSIPGFHQGESVNNTKDATIHRKYVYLDFFKFSGINFLLRVSPEEINQYSSALFSSCLTLSFFLGTGSFIEKTAVLFTDEAFAELKNLCRKVVGKIEEYPEFPVCDYPIFQKEFRNLTAFIQQNRIYPENISEKREDQRSGVLKECNRYYAEYLRLSTEPQPKTGENLLAKFEVLREAVSKDRTTNRAAGIKMELRSLRAFLDEKYSLYIKDFIPVKEFYQRTSHPYFIGLRYEAEILGMLYGIENSTGKNTPSVKSVLKELLPFYACRKNKATGPFHGQVTKQSEDHPWLVLAHHVHNANCKTLREIMNINRLIQWPVSRQVLNLSSSSSKEEVILNEREACIETGFNHYRIHARQHMKAGNQNRAIFNAINCESKEYYLTLDDDYFVFPEYPEIAHTEIVQENLEYYQSPLAFKGIYRPGASHGERADAEMMHYFESTLGNNFSGTYTFPRGTGTMFSFTEGISTLSDTGGFLIDFLSEDFGQGYLSMLQHKGLGTGKRVSTGNQGKVGDKIICIGEGVDLSGKVMQMIRWCHGAKIYFFILLPAIWKGLFSGKSKLVFNHQILRVLLFTPMLIASKFFGLVIYILPALLYAIIVIGPTKTLSLKLEAQGSLLLQIASLSIFYGLVHFFLIMRRFSLAPIRMILMDYLVTFYCVQGYIKGLLGMKPTWTANKTQKVKWRQYYGIFFPLAINALTALLSWADHLQEITLWASFNTAMYCLGLAYLMKEGNFSTFYKTVPKKWMFSTFKALTLLMAGLCLVYTQKLLIMLPQLTGTLNWIYFSFLLLIVLNFLCNLVVAGYSTFVNNKEVE